MTFSTSIERVTAPTGAGRGAASGSAPDYFSCLSELNRTIQSIYQARILPAPTELSPAAPRLPSFPLSPEAQEAEEKAQSSTTTRSASTTTSSTATPKTCAPKRNFSLCTETAEEAKQRDEKKGRKEGESTQAIAIMPSEKEILEEQLKVLTELPPLSKLSVETVEMVRKNVFAILAHKIPLSNKKVLLEVAKLGCDSKVKRDYWTYAISQHDQKLALELLECKIPLTLRFSGETLLEKLLVEDLDFVAKIFEKKPLRSIPKIINHAVSLFLRFLEKNQFPQAKLLAKELATMDQLRLGGIFLAVESYIESGDHQRIKFLFEEYPEVLKGLRKTVSETYAYTVEEFCLNTQDDPGFSPLIHAIIENQAELYPFLVFDDKNIGTNLYAYLQEVITKGNLERLQTLPEIIEKALALSTSPIEVFKTEFEEEFRIEDKRENLVLNLFSRIMYQIINSPGSGEIKEQEEKKEALKQLMLFLNKKFDFLSLDYQMFSSLVYEPLLLHRDAFPDDFVEQLIKTVSSVFDEQESHILAIIEGNLLVIAAETELQPSEACVIRKDLLVRCCRPENVIARYVDCRKSNGFAGIKEFKTFLKIYPGIDLNTLRFEEGPLLFHLLDHCEYLEGEYLFVKDNVELLLDLLKKRGEYGIDLHIEDPVKGSFFDYASSKLEELRKTLDLSDRSVEDLFKKLYNTINSLKGLPRGEP